MPSALGAAAAARPCAQARRRLGSPREGARGQGWTLAPPPPATLAPQPPCLATAERYVALSCTASTLTHPACIFGCQASSLSRSGHHSSNFTSTTHLPVAAGAALAGNVGTACRREPSVGGEDPLQAVFPIWLAVAFPNKSQVLPSGGAFIMMLPVMLVMVFLGPPAHKDVQVCRKR